MSHKVGSSAWLLLIPLLYCSQFLKDSSDCSLGWLTTPRPGCCVVYARLQSARNPFHTPRPCGRCAQREKLRPHVLRYTCA